MNPRIHILGPGLDDRDDVPPPTDDPAKPAIDATAFLTNDSGSCDRLLATFGDDLRFVPGVGWHRWDGTRWVIGPPPRHQAEQCARRVMREGRDMGGPAGEAVEKWGRQSGNASRIAGCVDLAEYRPEIRIEAEQLDADPFVFNCANGTIDLRTGKMREHRRDDLITKISPIAYDEKATCPGFLEFLGQCMGNDSDATTDADDLLKYVLRFLGYAMTGSVREHVFGLWHGGGRNGKSTLINIMLHVLGGYGGAIPSDVLLDHAFAQHSTGVMDLQGRRFVATVEPPAGKRWNESLIKQLTGGDPVTARRMRMDPVTFQPTHKIVMACNARPIVREQTEAFWTRVAAVPFDVSFRGREDRELDAKLAAEAPGILRLLVLSCVEWQRVGLNPPARVVAAGQEYRASQDTIGMFAADNVVEKADAFVPRKDLYQRFRTWAEEGGEYLCSASQFYRMLEERGWKPHKRVGVLGFADWTWATEKRR